MPPTTYHGPCGDGPMTHIGNSAFKEVSVLGKGYSGQVKEVRSIKEKGKPYALKVSAEKQIRFSVADVPVSTISNCNVVFHEAAEFEKLRKLYSAGVPVPQPFGFQLYSDAEGKGYSSVLMELVRGQTLRDWLSQQHGNPPGSKVDPYTSQKSEHPPQTVPDAIARIEVAIAVIDALVKLRPMAFFADFKPRNLMVEESTDASGRNRILKARLVDIGGVVMYQDLSRDTTFKQVGPDEQPILEFQPLRDRYLIETTCSYLSPEMALLISEYDLCKRRLSNHWFRTRREVATLTGPLTGHLVEKACQHERILKAMGWFNNRRATRRDLEAVDLRVTLSYLETRETFEQMKVLNCATHYDPSFPTANDLVKVSEKSSVFTMGLILVELFGGKRTGLTALTRLEEIHNLFVGHTGNSEFRMVMEWEKQNPLITVHQKAKNGVPQRLDMASMHSTRCSSGKSSAPASQEPGQMCDKLEMQPCCTRTCSHFGNKRVSSKRYMDPTSKHQGEELGSFIYPGEYPCQMCQIYGKEVFMSYPPPPPNCFFECYRQEIYPREGILSAWGWIPPPNSPVAGVSQSLLHDVSDYVQSLLDQCLRLDPTMRPSLLELQARLEQLRHLLMSVYVNAQANHMTAAHLTSNSTGVMVVESTETASSKTSPWSSLDIAGGQSLNGGGSNNGGMFNLARHRRAFWGGASTKTQQSRALGL